MFNKQRSYYNVRDITVNCTPKFLRHYDEMSTCVLFFHKSEWVRDISYKSYNYLKHKA